jgi:predicted transcriptional regulator
MKSKRKGETSMFRTSIELPNDLYKRLAHLSIDENRTLKEIMTEAIEQYVSRKEKGGGKK